MHCSALVTLNRVESVRPVPPPVTLLRWIRLAVPVVRLVRAVVCVDLQAGLSVVSVDLPVDLPGHPSYPELVPVASTACIEGVHDTYYGHLCALRDLVVVGLR